jgi:Ran GTPase-activating protein (RanGAP) involved in mRNA processing and transport
MASSGNGFAPELIILPLDIYKHNLIQYLPYGAHRKHFRIACKRFMDIVKLHRHVITAQKILDTSKLSKTVEIFDQLRGHRLKSRESFLGLSEALKLQRCSVSLLDLSNCNLSQSFLPALIDALKQCGSLRSLILVQTKLRPQKASFIADLLRANTPLTELDLTYNKLESSGLQVIADALQHHTTLRTLHLTNSMDLGEHNFAYLEEILTKNQSLTHLNVTYSVVHSLVLTPLFRGLQQNRSLKKLQLQNGTLDKTTAPLLKRALSVNTTLEVLALGYVPGPPGPWEEAVSAFETNSTLKELSFWAGSEVNIAFFNALAFPNCGIQRVACLTHTRLLVDAVAALARALKVNTRIVRLSVWIEAAALPLLADAVSVNASIQRLGIHMDVWDQDGLDATAAAMEKNTSVSQLFLRQKTDRTSEVKNLDFGPVFRSLAARQACMLLLSVQNFMPHIQSPVQGFVELLESRKILMTRFHWFEGQTVFSNSLMKELAERPHLTNVVDYPPLSTDQWL